MIRRFFRWLADVPPSVASFGRRLERVEDELFAELDAVKRRSENLRGQLLTDARMIADLKRRLADVEDWLEGREPDELPEFELVDELPPEKYTKWHPERPLTAPKEDKRAV